MEARAIRLDKFNRIVTIVANSVPKIGYSGAEVKIADVPAVMLRTTASGRQPMPQWCLLLSAYWMAQWFSGPIATGTCIVCESARQLGWDGGQVMDDCDIFVCASCTRHWHGECAKGWCEDREIGYEPFRCPVCEQEP